MKTVLSSLILAFTFSAFAAAQETGIKGPRRVETVPADLGHCGQYLLRQGYAVINDQEALNKAVKEMKEYCASAFAPKIDFNKCILIGVISTVGGCPAGSRMNVTFEKTERF